MFRLRFSCRPSFTFALLALAVAATFTGCTTGKDQHLTGFGRFYHGVTGHYNYFFNARDRITQSSVKLTDSYKENYTKPLPIYRDAANENTSGESATLDEAMKKLKMNLNLHPKSVWAGDSYFWAGIAQYLKRDYKEAEQTFAYVVLNFNLQNENLAANTVKKNTVKKPAVKKVVKKTVKKPTKKPVKQPVKKGSSSNNGKSTTANKATNTTAKTIATAKKDTAKTALKTTVGKASVGMNEEAAPKPLIIPSDPSCKQRKYFWKHAPVRDEALLWLARTQIELAKYDDATEMLAKLRRDCTLPRRIVRQLPVVEAYLAMKQNDIYRASAKLEEAVAVTRNRHERTRYAYILGQLYEAQNRHDAAFAAFEKAKHGSPNFEMEFNAQLYEINHDHATGKASASEALSRCRAMLREAKNDDYADQIYYTMGKISLVEKDEPAALAFMRRGLMQPKATKPHKAEIYYTLAETFWKNERFALAKHYYDSTALNLEKTDPRLATVTKRAADLADIATHIETVELNDSLLRVAAMSDADRRALGKRILANEAKSKRAKALAEINAKLNEAAADRVTGIEGPNKAQFEPKALDSWWAYDEPTRKKQTRDFERKFGKRKLEDDWLRSQRKGANQTIDVDTTTATTSVAAVKNGKDSSATAANKASRNPNAKAKPLREEDREADEVFKDIPRTPEAIAAARGKIAEALAKLGDLYRLRLALPKRSADTDEDLLARFADKSKPYEREVFFTLFQDYTDLRNPAKADVYKQKLIGAYPESSLAKSLTNPAFATEQKQQAAALDTYYAETLRLKESGNAAAAAERIGKVDSLFGNAVKGSPLAPKFALLSAFCVGALNGKEAYIGALQKVVAGFPKTPEEARATEILGYLSGVAKPEPASVKAETVSYKSDLAGEHYILIWVKDAGAKLGDLKTAVGDYDRKYYNIRNLTVQVLTLDAKTIFAVVRRFDDDVTAKAYATQALSKTKEFTGSAVTSYAVMPISQANYTLLVQSRDLAQYASFAEKAYQMNVNK